MNSNLDDFIATHNPRVLALEARFRGHHGINRHVIGHWLGQFEADHTPLALKVLENIRYFNYENLTALIRQAVVEIPAQLHDLPADSIKYVIAGDIWEADATIARIIRNNQLIPRRQLIQYLELQNIKRGEIGALAFIKDFSGTGQQLEEWWLATAEPLVLPLEVPVLFYILVLNYSALNRLSNIGVPIISSFDLDPTFSVLSSRSTSFNDEEKDVIREYCRCTGASEEYVLGKGETSLLVAFDNGCPNNSLPILWLNSKTWSQLFQRRSY